MSDQTNATTPTGQAGQPAGQPSSPEVKGGAQPKFITLEEAQRMAQDAEENAFRRAQGLFDKGRDGIIKKVQGDLKALEQSLALQRKAGIEISQEQEDRLKSQVMSQAWISEEPESPPPAAPASGQPAQAPQAPAQPGEEPPDPVTAEAWAMMQEAGVTIDEGDPEYSMIDQETTSIRKFLQSVEKAIATKAQRTSARAPTGLGGTGQIVTESFDGKSLNEVWNAAKSQGRI